MHNGHIAFALRAAKQLELDKVFFLPERQPRTKKIVTSFEHRFEMLKLATEAHKNLEVLQVAGKHFSVNSTLPKLKAIFPGMALNLLVGSDIAKLLPSWNKADLLLKAMDLVIGLRNSDAQQDLQKKLSKLSKVDNLHFIKSPQLNISSDKVRRKQQLAVPVKVIEYIQIQKLY